MTDEWAWKDIDVSASIMMRCAMIRASRRNLATDNPFNGDELLFLATESELKRLRERGVVCYFCGKAWPYRGDEPPGGLLKECIDHEAVCEHNPYRSRLALAEKVVEAARELLEVSDLRGDIDDIPGPCDDPKLWTARLITAWEEIRAALAALKE